MHLSFVLESYLLHCEGLTGALHFERDDHTTIIDTTMVCTTIICTTFIQCRTHMRLQ